MDRLRPNAIVVACWGSDQEHVRADWSTLTPPGPSTSIDDVVNLFTFALVGRAVHSQQVQRVGAQLLALGRSEVPRTGLPGIAQRYTGYRCAYVARQVAAPLAEAQPGP